MDHLLSHWDAIENRLAGKNVFLFLDYDGTLAPIAETPDKAVIGEEAVDALSLVARDLRCATAIVTGRSIEDIRARVPVKGLIYAGNHGLEVEGEAVGSHVFVSKAARKIIQEIVIKLQEALVSVPGCLIENKGLTVSCHYRQVSQEDRGRVKAIFNNVLRPFQEEEKVCIVEGKKVLDVRPKVDWDKGKVALWLLEKPLFENDREIVSVCLGDDVTDIDAFKVLRDKGITVWVGLEPKFSTGYFLNDHSEVVEFLRRLKELLARKEDL